MAKCGAKKRKGGECNSPAMPNGRCRLHGGKTPETNQNAVKHGFYSKCYTPQERIDVETLRVGNLEAEIAAARITLKRAFSVSEFQEDGKTRNEHYRPDIIERMLMLIGRLEKQHNEINTDIGDGIDWAAVGKLGASVAKEMGATEIPRGAAQTDNGAEEV
jgi:hypothetical protein